MFSFVADVCKAEAKCGRALVLMYILQRNVESKALIIM